MPKSSCDKLEQFLESFNDPQSVSLVFSSAYPNNPASMFGHTFLKFNSKRNTDLLDMGLNYAAVVADDENPFAFFWFGLTGGYPGQWSTQPYYVKVAEYVSFESRDLWEYKLALTQEQTNRLLRHIWEIEVNGNFEYYFFDENCSFQVLTSLEAIMPSWEIVDRPVHMIPGESVKYLMKDSSRVTEINFRPSYFKKIHAAYANLDSEQKNKLHDYFLNHKEFSSEDDLKFVDTYLLFLEYKRNANKKDFEKNHLEYQKKLLLYRATLPPNNVPLYSEDSIDKSSAPHLGHDAWSAQMGFGSRDVQTNKNNFLSLKIKSAYHDLLNADAGYSPYAHIDFPWIDVRYFERKNEWIVQKINIVSTTSLTPSTDLKNSFAFKGGASFESLDWLNCPSCLSTNGYFGGGIATNTWNNFGRLYFFIGLEGVATSRIKNGYGIGTFAEVGGIQSWNSIYKTQVNFKNLWPTQDADKRLERNILSFNQSLSIERNKEIRNTLELTKFKMDSKRDDLDLGIFYIQFFN